MYSVFVTEQFRDDLDGLDKAIREKVPETIKRIEEDPQHPGLHTHKHITVTNRAIFRSRINESYRILWEWLGQGSIGLWRVGKHDFVDVFTSLPGVEQTEWEALHTEIAPTTESILDWRNDLDKSQPFKHFPNNHLRLFGVPDEYLDAVRMLDDPETIWDLTIPENVQYTLYDILLKGTDWTADRFLDTKQLLYRTTVDQLEGYCEGKIKRLLLNLTDEQTALVRVSASGPILIKGVAGSGKTTIGLYRAHYLAEVIDQQHRMFGEQTSILLLTFSRTLARSLKQLYSELYGKVPHTITIDTYSSWMLRQLYPNRSALPDSKYPIATNEKPDYLRKQLIHQAREEITKQYPEDNIISSRPLDFLLSEIDDVIRARGLETLEEYQIVSRVGRGTGLDRERHRPLVWQIYERYQQLLDERQLVDFADLPRLMLKRCNPLPKYDVVIIDEAQDLPPVYLRLASKLISDFEESRSLTLLADPAQSIYYRGISWKESGINVRGGRTRTLAKNFRNTQQILEAARSILDGCGDLKLEDEYIPPTSTHRLGPKPVLAQYGENNEAMLFVVHTIVKLCQSEKYRPGDIAVLARNDDLSLSALRKLLSKENIPWVHFRDKQFEILENQVKLLTMHSAKGLEFPVVFLIDLREGTIPYITSRETEETDLAQERKLFYVSMTRASERLYLLYPKQSRCRFIRDIASEVVTEVQCRS
jgi:superfamily I DNA/RNA helicase/mRNA-degrading endonuclease RelE of RelBE toxin-antitoxin system